MYKCTSIVYHMINKIKKTNNLIAVGIPTVYNVLCTYIEICNNLL